MEHTDYTFGPNARFAWYRSLTLPSSIKTTLHMMLKYTDSRTGETIISQRKLAYLIGKKKGKPALTVRTIYRHQKELERLCLIERQETTSPERMQGQDHHLEDASLECVGRKCPAYVRTNVQ